ncbi:MAG: BamA/TamA family outer membrane protein [Candidatus Zixiibacteriota bacterium]
MRRIWSRPILISFMCCLAVAVEAVEPQYKEYTAPVTRVVYFEISFDERFITIGVPHDTTFASLSFARQNLRLFQDSVVLSAVATGDYATFRREGLLVGDSLYRYDRISDMDIRFESGETFITCYTRKTTDSGAVARRGNRISFDDRVRVAEGAFVRGMIFTVKGSVTVDGEVNRAIVSLFGDIDIGPTATVRGDLASITGVIDASRDAAVYGDVYSGAKKGAPRKHRFVRREKGVELIGTFRYDRVDGAAPYVGLKFTDQDSLLPSVWGEIGHGFASKRWRYEAGMEQIVWRKIPIAVGGSYHRRLASGDDWIIRNTENLAFTLLAKEDFKDYYEAEGGTVYVKARPVPKLEFETRYRNEDLRWLKAHRNLWSLFGGDKQFRDNFSTVSEPFHTQGIADIDSATRAVLSFKVDYDTRSAEDLFKHSAWALTGELDWSTKDLNSSFDYRRYTLSFRRYQRINRYTMLLGRLMYGGSDGYLPMYDRFFVGGLGTMAGYYHKEYMGTRFWITNAEYRVGFPHSDLAFSILWDMAQIANEQKLNGDVEVKHSLGAAMYIGDEFKLSLAKRLDRSYRDNPKFYVRLDHVF